MQSLNGGIAVRQAPSTDQLAAAPARQVWSDSGAAARSGPEIAVDGSRYYIYFSAGPGAAQHVRHQLRLPRRRPHRRDTARPAGQQVGHRRALFTLNGQRWFVWSGWAGDTNVEQNLYVARMSSPTTPTGARYIISQPREGWERVVGNPFINEGPEPIKDPNGQLHIVYSANGSWSDQYCLADLRLRAGGDPTYVWDWYKSNGCLFGSNRATVMAELGSHPVRQRPRPPQLRAAQRRHQHQPAAGPRFP